jgi:hypothetical protein
MTVFQLAPSILAPIAIGFFGLGMGYFVWGGQAFFGWPQSSPETDRTIGLWGVWMPGFMQFITGVYLMVGLTWFGVFGGAKPSPLYMAAVAFTAYGVHWFVMGHRRYIGASSQPDGWMAIAFLLLSILGILVFVFASPNDLPVAILFLGLSLIYLSEIPARFLNSKAAGRLVGMWQLLTGIWLMYLTYATVFNLALGQKWWL